MSIRSKTMRRHGDNREPRGHESKEERFQRQRAEYEEQHAPPVSPLRKLKSMFRPRSEKPVEREEENPTKQPQKVYIPPSPARPRIQPSHTQQRKQAKKAYVGAIGLIKKFGRDVAEGGKEIVRDIERRQDREGGVDAAIGDFIGVRGGGSSGGKQRINEHGYIEVMGRDGRWIFTGKKARFKIPRTGYDEATGLEYEAEQEGAEEPEDVQELVRGSRGQRINSRGSRQPRGNGYRPQGGIPPISTQQAPAWHTGVSGMTGTQQEPMGAREPVIGSGLAVMSTGMFPMVYGQERQQPVAEPEEEIEYPPVKLSRKKRKQLEQQMAMMQQRKQQPPPQERPSNPLSLSAFQEVFGDRVRF